MARAHICCLGKLHVSVVTLYIHRTIYFHSLCAIVYTFCASFMCVDLSWRKAKFQFDNQHFICRYDGDDSTPQVRVLTNKGNARENGLLGYSLFIVISPIHIDGYTGEGDLFKINQNGRDVTVSVIALYLISKTNYDYFELEVVTSWNINCMIQTLISLRSHPLTAMC